MGFFSTRLGDQSLPGLSAFWSRGRCPDFRRGSSSSRSFRCQRRIVRGSAGSAFSNASPHSSWPDVGRAPTGSTASSGSACAQCAIAIPSNSDHPRGASTPAAGRPRRPAGPPRRLDDDDRIGRIADRSRGPPTSTGVSRMPEMSVCVQLCAVEVAHSRLDLGLVGLARRAFSASVSMADCDGGGAARSTPHVAPGHLPSTGSAVRFLWGRRDTGWPLGRPHASRGTINADARRGVRRAVEPGMGLPIGNRGVGGSQRGVTEFGRPSLEPRSRRSGCVRASVPVATSACSCVVRNRTLSSTSSLKPRITTHDQRPARVMHTRCVAKRGRGNRLRLARTLCRISYTRGRPRYRRIQRRRLARENARGRWDHCTIPKPRPG